MTGHVGSAVFSSRVVRRSFHLQCSGVKESSLRAGKLISCCSQGLRLPSVGCLVDAAAWLDGSGRLQKNVYSFLEAKGLTQLDSQCLRRECHYRLVDAIVNRVLPREVAQAVKYSNDTRFYGVGSGDVGKKLPRTKSVLCVWTDSPMKHQQEKFPGCMFVPGIILRVNHCCTKCPPHINSL